MGNYVVDPHAKFHKDTITPFRPPNTRKFASSDSASFFLVLPSAYSQDPCTDFHDQYVKWRRFAQGCAFWGHENKILHFDPIFPKKRKFLANFRRDFRVKKALTMGMLESKLHLIVIVAPWKLYSE